MKPEQLRALADALSTGTHYVESPELHEAMMRAADVEAERDDLRRQLDPMGEYASADELIAALRAEKAADDAMKQDARRYRFIRDADRSDAFMPIESILCYSMDSLDAAIDAAMGLTRPAEES